MKRLSWAIWQVLKTTTQIVLLIFFMLGIPLTIVFFTHGYNIIVPVIGILLYAGLMIGIISHYESSDNPYNS